jgi:hypothetical protein
MTVTVSDVNKFSVVLLQVTSNLNLTEKLCYKLVTQLKII